MKGMVFVELLRMAEEALGEDVVDRVLDTTPTSCDGAFTAVGNYPCSDLMALVAGFSTASGLPPDDLQKLFGRWMLGRFHDLYPQFFEGKKDAFAMLEAIEGEIHVEVRKLYPEVELPSFETRRLSEAELAMTYTSERPLVAFCEGLIRGCLDHFGSGGSVELLAQSDGARKRADFLVRQGA
ncbi:Heme NO binding protein [Pseudoruegeria aquimaris]|uniref:Heme NO binding protein n=1 Tax=Pseudoruegeria aquimaris TaxID=393663 RepID=A0A1Y5SL92_9RHOB|nr:heme NO-binding domain-containing protein [Pseudoruegeria aquimaris]SLN42184.1 Heme NO binding protein [Pseudoruegeria aquimaris]